MTLNDHEMLETLIQAVTLYRSSLQELLEGQATRPSFHRLPSELESLYKDRIDRCAELRKQFYERQVELHLDAETPAAEPPATPRKRKAARQ